MARYPLVDTNGSASGDVPVADGAGGYAWGPVGPSSTAPIPITQQSGNYSLLASDLFTRVEYTGSGAGTFTVPSGLGARGDVIELGQVGTGKLSVAAGAGVTVHSPGGLMSASAQYATLGLICEGSNVWTLSGSLGS